MDALEHCAQKAFPTRLLHECDSAVSFFCAQFYGKNDVIHLYASGIPNVTLVDTDTEKLARMKELYPEDWEIIEGDAFAVAARFQNEKRKFDAVVCDPYSSLGEQVSFDEFQLFHSIASKYLVVLYNLSMFERLGIEPERKALADVLERQLGTDVDVVDVIKRSSHAGGIYWTVFRA